MASAATTATVDKSHQLPSNLTADGPSNPPGEPGEGLRLEEVERMAAEEFLVLVRHNNATGYKGVTLSHCSLRSPYQAHSRFKGRKVHLGVFSTAWEAGLCYARHVGPAQAQREAAEAAAAGFGTDSLADALTPTADAEVFRRRAHALSPGTVSAGPAAAAVPRIAAPTAAPPSAAPPSAAKWSARTPKAEVDDDVASTIATLYRGASDSLDGEAAKAALSLQTLRSRAASGLRAKASLLTEEHCGPRVGTPVVGARGARAGSSGRPLQWQKASIRAN
jgi:hypothetical protein